MKESNKRIGDLIRWRAEKTPANPALCFEGRQYSYRELERGSDALAAFLLGLGIGPGVHAGIWSTNSSDYVFLYLALVKIGALPVLFNSFFRSGNSVRRPNIPISASCFMMILKSGKRLFLVWRKAGDRYAVFP